MLRQPDRNELLWSSLIEIANRRSKFFLKHGERFDRRLYAEIEAIIRISLKLHASDLINADPDKFKELVKIQRDLLHAGQEQYVEFP